MVNIFDYLDYRKFLFDFCEERKKVNPNFSYRYMAMKTGFSHSTFVRVLGGERNISLRLSLKLSELIKLNKNAADYFQLLVLFNQARNHDERKGFLERIMSHKGSKVRTLASDQFEYFDKWYYVAIRELLSFYPFTGDFAALAKQLVPPVKPEEAQRAVQTMERLGLLKREPSGLLKPTDLQVGSGEEWNSVAIQQYQLNTINLARDALDRFSKMERDISTLALHLSSEGLLHLKEKLRQFRLELLEVEQQDTGANRVFQMNFQLFPLTEDPLKEKQ